ncbi:MAG: hypothetical protein CVV44_01935 [Spirochaetae bacterium HGW-Spirochaetae-1]|jgi:uncharacterized protein (DUF362 family)|nr:MAG: hypothetical protein CVV44_01935 [Spirochaetae bacterium HGW-Spirochaetae-1]
MERREFLKIAAGVAMTAVHPLSGCADLGKGHALRKPVKEGLPAKVFLSGTARGASEKDIRTAVRETALAATDFSWLTKRDTVFIKTVNNSGNPYPATTSPVAVAAMIELLREKGARRVIVGDMSGVQFVRFTRESLKGSSRKLMEKAGLAQAVIKAGAELHCFEEAGWDAFHEDRPVEGAHWKGPIMMPNILKEADHIILMPRCSRHILAGSTLGLKAAVGYWRHDTRLEYHHDASTLHEKTAEANTVETLRKKQRLVLTTADKILTTVGPDDGYVYEPERGLNMASESVVAHEMVSLAWLLANRHDMPESERDGFLDSSKMVPRMVNRVVNNFLSGWGKAITADTFIKNDISGIWDDRVLAHACHVYGGVPRTSLVVHGGTVTEDLKKRLAEMISLPA